MRHLFFLRHGKAAWPEEVYDHQRPLTQRGEHAIQLEARALLSIVPRIDLVLVSDARRTRESFAAFAKVIPDLTPHFKNEIYEADPNSLLEIVQDLPSEAKNVLMIGHNPGLPTLALYLADAQTSDGAALHRLDRKFPTASLIHLETEKEWDELEHASMRLAHYITPAQLGGVDED